MSDMTMYNLPSRFISCIQGLRSGAKTLTFLHNPIYYCMKKTTFLLLKPDLLLHACTYCELSPHCLPIRHRPCTYPISAVSCPGGNSAVMPPIGAHVNRIVGKPDASLWTDLSGLTAPIYVMQMSKLALTSCIVVYKLHL